MEPTGLALQSLGLGGGSWWKSVLGKDSPAVSRFGKIQIMPLGLGFFFLFRL